MQRVNRDEYEEDYGDYNAEGEEQEGEGYCEEEEGDGYEGGEEEYPQPTQEELEYLELRQRIKESIRKKKMKGSSGLSNTKEERKLPYDNFGSFFGPSQPVIAQRVIQESKSLLENPRLASQMLSGNLNRQKNSASNGSGLKIRAPTQSFKVNETKKKVEIIKMARDYSFLSNDDELPVPSNGDYPAKSVSVRKSDAPSSERPTKGKQIIGNSSRYVQRQQQRVHQEKKSVPPNGQVHSKAGSYRTHPVSKPTVTVRPLESNKKQLSVNAQRKPGAVIERKVPTPVPRNLPPDPRGVSSSKTQVSDPRKQLEAKRRLQEPDRARLPPKPRPPSQEIRRDKVVPKQPLPSSEPQRNRPYQPAASHAKPQVRPPKRKELSEDDKAIMMIRGMFNTQRYADIDDRDIDMEANFDQILREETRSARLARKEDEEQQRLIEEEERQERMRLAKKRKGY